MAEKVEVVIKIPKYYLTHPQDYSCIAECVRRGTILPKHHGDLVDRNELLEYTDINECAYIPTINRYDIITTPAIIKADKEGENETDS